MTFLCPWLLETSALETLKVGQVNVNSVDKNKSFLLCSLSTTVSFETPPLPSSPWNSTCHPFFKIILSLRSFTIFTSFTRKENRQYSSCCLASICIQFSQLVFGLVKHHTLSRGVGSTLYAAWPTKQPLKWR